MTIGSADAATPSSTELVYRSIQELYDMGRIPTREILMTETGLRFSQVDDSVKRLLEQKRIRRPVNGVFEPTISYENRAVSVTIVHGTGIVKAEIGEMIMELTPAEGRALAKLLAGMVLGYGR